MTQLERLFNKVKGQGRTQLDLTEAKELLTHCGISVLKDYKVTTAKEAAAVFQEIGRPIVMKIISPDVLHKSDLGGIQINILSPEQAEASFEKITGNIKRQLPGAVIEGVLIEEQLFADYELIVGALSDDVFGPVVMFGFGGIYVEVFKDIAFRLAPVTKKKALEMMKECSIYKVLQGFRGKRPVEMEALVDTIISLSECMVEWQDSLKELEVNPLMVVDGELIAADARAILRSM